MTTKYDPTAPSAPVRRPARLPGWVAVVVVLGVLGAAGYGGWRLIKPAPPVDLSQYESNEGRPGRGPRARSEPVESVEVRPDGAGVAQVRNFAVQFMGGTKPNLIARGQPSPGIEDRAVVRSRNQILNDAAVRKTAGVSDEQAAKLRTVTVVQPQAVDGPNRAALLDLWAKLRAADAAARPGAEKAVLDAVRAAAEKYAAASAAAYHTQADQIRGVLTADQLAKARAR